jgi:opacity protein-like surface antigen
LGYEQRVPRLEVSGGYSFLNAGTSALTSRQNLNGFESSAVINVNRWLAAEGNVSAYYKSLQILNVGTFGFHDYAFMGGPRFNVRKMFLHGLVGVDHLAGSTNFFATSASSSDNAIAAAVGGGVQWKVSRMLAVRTSADYVLSRFEGATQSNFRITTGIVFQAGSVNSRGF